MLKILLDDCDFDSFTRQQQDDWIKSYEAHRKTDVTFLRSYQLQMFILLAERELDIPEGDIVESKQQLHAYREMQVRYLLLCQEQVNRLLRRHWDLRDEGK